MANHALHPRSPVGVCHRGASALAPENTLRAFELAIAHGADLAELDVHLSRDGELMVIHDSDLQRLAGVPERVDALTAEELGRLDVGSGHGVPRLTQVIALARGRLGLYVELKGAGTGAALGHLARASGADGVSPLIGGSFLPSLVAELREVAPEVPRSMLFRHTSLHDMVRICRQVDARYAHPCFRPVDAGLVGALHAADLLVMTPHTNDPVEACSFASIGVDVIASDDPRVLAAAGLLAGEHPPGERAEPGGRA